MFYFETEEPEACTLQGLPLHDDLMPQSDAARFNPSGP